MTGFIFYVVGQLNDAKPMTISGFNSYYEAEDLLVFLEENATPGTVFYITTHPPEEQNGL